VATSGAGKNGVIVVVYTSTDTGISRKFRLFQGYTIKILGTGNNRTIRILQQ
jgi:hypothetical protein